MIHRRAAVGPSVSLGPGPRAACRLPLPRRRDCEHTLHRSSAGSRARSIVHIETDQLGGGHRFASDTLDPIHPFAINNATSCCRLLIIRGREYTFVDRYETWVQYRSRALPQRVDLDPLRSRLEARETGTASWTASRPSTLVPVLRSSNKSSISATNVKVMLIEHLRSAPGAWNPFVYS